MSKYSVQTKLYPSPFLLFGTVREWHHWLSFHLTGVISQDFWELFY